MVLAVLCNTLPRYSSLNVEIAHGVCTYYVGSAISFVLIIAAQKYQRDKKIHRAIYRTVFWLAISNLMDELFFDPLNLGINEVVFACFIILREYYIYCYGSKT